MSSAAKSIPSDLLLSDLTMNTTTYNHQTTTTHHISYMHTHIPGTRLQNKITNITETNKIYKTNFHKTRWQLYVISGGYVQLYDYHNNGIVSRDLVVVSD